MATVHRTEPTTINEDSYVIGHMDTRKQLHVARRLAPMVGAMGGVLKRAYEVGLFKLGDSESFSLDNLDDETQKTLIVTGLETIETAAPLLGEALSKMSDEDADYVVNSCLACVKRKNGKSWSPVFTNGAIMFDDLGLDVILKLVWLVIKDNISSFFLTNLRGPGANAGKAN